MASLTILQEARAPYRQSLFDYLADAHDITVCYMEGEPGDRNWTLQPREEYDTVSVPSVKLWLFDKCVVFPEPLHLSYALWQRRNSQLVYNDDLRLILPTLLALIATYIFRSERIFWCSYFGGEHYKGLPSLLRRLIQLYRVILANGTRRYLGYSDKSVGYYKSLTRHCISAHISSQAVASRKQLDRYQGAILPELTREERSDRAQILYLGYLHPRKNVEILIRAHKLLRSDSFHSSLVIAGSGSEDYSVKLRQLAAGQSEIKFTGYVEGTQKEKILQESDILALCSSHDVWGNVVNEAFMFGTPAIVSDSVGAANELVIDGYNGYCISEVTPQSVAHEIRRFCELEDAERVAMRLAALISVQPYVYENVEKAISLLSEPRRRAG